MFASRVNIIFIYFYSVRDGAQGQVDSVQVVKLFSYLHPYV